MQSILDFLSINFSQESIKNIREADLQELEELRAKIIDNFAKISTKLANMEQKAEFIFYASPTKYSFKKGAKLVFRPNRKERGYSNYGITSLRQTQGLDVDKIYTVKDTKNWLKLEELTEQPFTYDNYDIARKTENK